VFRSVGGTPNYGTRQSPMHGEWKDRVAAEPGTAGWSEAVGCAWDTTAVVGELEA
jgi:hypothetical protein